MSNSGVGHENKGFEPESKTNEKNGSALDSIPASDYFSVIAAKEAEAKFADAASIPASEYFSTIPTKGAVEDDPEMQGPNRMQWDSQWEFLMSCIAMSVGLGNIWRFPVTAYENGGGAFLIPYFIVLLVIGRPIYFLELCLGQFTSYSQIKVWTCTPFFKGVGYGTMIAMMCVLTYYCSIMALTLFYFIASFQKTLPWTECRESWAGEGNCNGTQLINSNQSLAEAYYLREVLNDLDSIDDGIGNPDWRLTLCLGFSWLMVLFTLIRGVKSSGKVAYFTALFPYVVLLILLIRGVTLEGAGDGIIYFIKPQWDKLTEPKVWYAAVSQCFFSLNTGFGSIIMFASYNPFHHNIYRDAWIVSIMDTFTSLLAGVTIFAVLGNLAYELDTDVENVVRGGNGLAFISYPEAIAKFAWAPQLFAVLFFLMLFVLGLGSTTADSGAIVTIFCDRFPNVARWKVTSAVCITGFLFGLIYVTPGGQWMLDLVDYFGGGFVIYTVSTLEVIGVAWGYGLFRFIDDIEFMLNVKLGWYWKITWGFLIPVGLTVILVYSLIVDDELTYNELAYPTAAIVCGWLIAAVALLAFPIGAMHALWRSEGNFMQRLRKSFQPSPKWGPLHPKDRKEWKEFLAHKSQ